MTEGPPARSGGRRWLVVLAWALWAVVPATVVVTVWLDRLLGRAGRSDLAIVTADFPAYVLGVMSAATVGALLAGRRPRHPVGWLLLGLGLPVALSGVATGYANYGLEARPGSLPAAGYAAVWHGVSVTFMLASLGFVLLLTPTGSLPSPRWRWWARVMVAAATLAVVSSTLLPFEPPYEAFANPLAIPGPTDLLLVVSEVAWIAIALGVPVGAGSLALRFRRARGVERLQLRWLALAAGLASATILVAMAAVAVAPTVNEVLLGWLTAICLALLPVATGAAILRYRLYDLDRIVSRTVAYGLLTVLLGGGYAAVVLGLGRLLPQDSSLAVAAATLAVAAAFQPARRRVQQQVDRRFNRRRYDAARTIGAFSDRLRQQVDLDALTGELLAVAEQTMQPTQAWLWLRPAPAPTRARARVG